MFLFLDNLKPILRFSDWSNNIIIIITIIIILIIIIYIYATIATVPQES